MSILYDEGQEAIASESRRVAEARSDKARLLGLLEKGCEVSYSDPYIPRIELEQGSLESVEASDDALAAAEAVLIVTDHGCYDPLRIARAARLVIDTRNATGAAVGVDPSLGVKIRRI